MNHIDDLITAYLDNTLDPASKEKVKSHLVFCVDCKEKLTEISQMIKVLNEAPKVEPPIGLEARILSKLREDVDSPAGESFWESFRFGFRWRIVAVSMASFLGVFMVFKMKRSPYNSAVPESPIAFTQTEAGARQNDFHAEGLMNKEESVPSQKMAGEKKSDNEVLAKLNVGNDKNLVQPSSRGQLKNAPAVDYGKLAESSPRRKIIPGEPSSEKIDAERLDRFSGGSKAKTEFTAQSGIMDESSPSGYNKGFMAKDSSDFKKGPKAHFIGEKIITKESELNDLLAQLSLDTYPVDFDEEDIMAIVLPTEPALGTTVNVTLIEISAVQGVQTRIITYSINHADNSALRGQAFNTPYLIKVIPKFSGKTIFRRNP